MEVRVHRRWVIWGIWASYYASNGDNEHDKISSNDPRADGGGKAEYEK